MAFSVSSFFLKVCLGVSFCYAMLSLFQAVHCGLFSLQLLWLWLVDLGIGYTVSVTETYFTQQWGKCSRSDRCGVDSRVCAIHIACLLLHQEWWPLLDDKSFLRHCWYCLWHWLYQHWRGAWTTCPPTRQRCGPRCFMRRDGGKNHSIPSVVSPPDLSVVHDEKVNRWPVMATP